MGAANGAKPDSRMGASWSFAGTRPSGRVTKFWPRLLIKGVTDMQFKLYPSKDAAMFAVGEWARDIRAGWKLRPLISRAVVDPVLIQPLDQSRLTGKRLAGLTVCAEGEFVRYGVNYAATESSLFAAAWEVHQ